MTDRVHTLPTSVALKPHYIALQIAYLHKKYDIDLRNVNGLRIWWKIWSLSYLNLCSHHHVVLVTRILPLSSSTYSLHHIGVDDLLHRGSSREGCTLCNFFPVHHEENSLLKTYKSTKNVHRVFKAWYSILFLGAKSVLPKRDRKGVRKNMGGWGSRVLNFLVNIQIQSLYGIFDHS